MGNSVRSSPAPAERPAPSPDGTDSDFLAVLSDYPSPDISPPIFRRGEKLRVISDEGGWWKAISLSTGRESYIPGICVARVYHGWLFEGLGRDKAEELLQLPDTKIGSFMIRESETKKGFYSLSVKHRQVKHYRIFRLPNNWYYISPRLTFQCLEDLVNHYSGKKHPVGTGPRCPSLLTVPSVSAAHGPQDTPGDSALLPTLPSPFPLFLSLRAAHFRLRQAASEAARESKTQLTSASPSPHPEANRSGMSRYSQPQTERTSLSEHAFGPLRLCSEMPLISPFLGVKILVNFQDQQVATFLMKPLSPFPLLPGTPGTGILPGDLVNCAVVCVCRQALRHRGLYFMHPYVLPGPGESSRCSTLIQGGGSRVCQCRAHTQKRIWHVEAQGLGVELVLQPPAYTAATATSDP
uniref:Src-like-adapter n=1 Tax=Sus scrofa TaxID=9823 RepID=A0A8D0SGS5_PIG